MSWIYGFIIIIANIITVLFCDIRNFTALSEKMSAKAFVLEQAFLQAHSQKKVRIHSFNKSHDPNFITMKTEPDVRRNKLLF